MSSRSLVAQAAVFGLWSAALLAQQAPEPSPRPALHEFALTLQQSVESGKTRIGTKVQARLATATVLDGTSIPRNAVFSGVVIESTAKGEKEPAKLAIRMETAQWKNGTTSMTAYLLPLYYGAAVQDGQSLPNGAQDPSSRTLNGPGQSESPMSQPFTTNDAQAAQAAIPENPAISSRPVRMKNVAVVRADEGGAALQSERSNIKLFKQTTYVFASVELPTQ